MGPLKDCLPLRSVVGSRDKNLGIHLDWPALWKKEGSAWLGVPPLAHLRGCQARRWHGCRCSELGFQASQLEVGDNHLTSVFLFWGSFSHDDPSFFFKCFACPVVSRLCSVPVLYFVIIMKKLFYWRHTLEHGQS